MYPIPNHTVPIFRNVKNSLASDTPDFSIVRINGFINNNDINTAGEIEFNLFFFSDSKRKRAPNIPTNRIENISLNPIN